MSLGVHALKFSSGFSSGYSYGVAKNAEDEVKQGKNYYIASLYLCTQLAALGMVVKEVANTFFKGAAPRSLGILCDWGALFILPVTILIASVKQGDYARFADKHALAPKLGKISVKVLHFFAEHSGDLIRVAMAVGTVALICLGQYVFGGALLTAFIYRELDARHFVPRKISLFMENWLPIVASIGFLASGTILLQAIAALQLITYIPSANRFMLHKIDALFRFVTRMPGYSLAEYEAPIKERRNMTFAQINQILDAKESDFEIDPTHCSKWATDFSKLPEDSQFDDFLKLYDAAYPDNPESISKNHKVIRGKLKTDEVFCDFLREKYPSKDIETNFDECVKELALKKGQTEEAYIAAWTREQMLILVDVLQDRRKVKGSGKDLDEAIGHFKKILPYVKSSSNESDRQDILLKIAVEGGNYCARALRRLSDEIVRETVAPQGLPEFERQKLGVREHYELRIRQALQNDRYRCIQETYLEMKEVLEKMRISSSITTDVHGFDIYRKFLSLGFYPMTEAEKNMLGLSDISMWEMIQPIRHEMHASYMKYDFRARRYNLDRIVHEQGEQAFTDYILHEINTNSSLSESEKETLLEKFSSSNDYSWSPGDTESKFHRLMLVTIGVLRFKKQNSR